MLLGGVFKATGNASPATIPAKGRYMFQDLDRYAKRYGVPLKFNPHFPINTLMLMRAVTGMQLRHPERFQAFIDCLFKALWVEGRSLDDPATVAAVLTENGFDPNRSAGPDRRRRGQSRAQGQHRESGATRRIRRTEHVCR